MAAGLQEQRIGDDGGDRNKGQKARNRVLWAVQQDTQHEAALGLRFNHSRFRTATATS